MADFTGSCPICDARINLPQDTEESEIINCTECNNSIVVESISENQVTLEEAPEIEEDWGE